MRILLVDDNSEIGNMLQKYFTLTGNTCSITSNGHDALSIIQKNKFDVVLLDLAMPEYSGYDLLEALKKYNLLKNNRIVVLTATALSTSNVDTLAGFGVTKILRKPIAPDDILAQCTC